VGVNPKLLVRHGFKVAWDVPDNVVYERKFKHHEVFVTFDGKGCVKSAGIVDNDGVFFPFKRDMKANELAVALKIFVE
jgi:hypothetical protein